MGAAGAADEADGASAGAAAGAAAAAVVEALGFEAIACGRTNTRQRKANQ